MAAALRPKNLVPLAHVEHGWVFGNSISVFGEDIGGLVQLPIDEIDRYFTPPFAIAIALRQKRGLRVDHGVGQHHCHRSPPHAGFRSRR